MPNIKISQLPQISSVDVTDLDVLPIVDVNVMTTKKVTVQDLRTAISSGITPVLITGGTYSNGTTTLNDSTGGTVSITGYSIATSGTTLYSTNPATTNFDTNNSIFFGDNAGRNTTLASASVFLGSFAGADSSLTLSSVIIGYQTGYSSQTSSSSVMIGPLTGWKSISCSPSIFLGQSAGFEASNSQYPTFIGNSAGGHSKNCTGSNFIGTFAGSGVTGGSYSNLIGYNVGKSFTSNNIGSNNIIIGTNISLSDTASDSINIGGVLFGTGTYLTVSGDPSILPTTTGKIGISVVNPTSKLDISGQTGYDQLRLHVSYTPTGTTDTNGNTGDVAWDNTYFYWKTSGGWLRISGETW